MKSSCLIIAGEKSGEEHAMTFFPELTRLAPETSFWGVGGDELQAQGMQLLYHLNEFNAWGISEVITKIPYYIRAFNRILEEVDRRQCRTAILIDFQDFNLRLAKKLKERGVNVLYYVAPTAWIWKAWRAEALAKSVHTLFTIYPFEKEWFLQRGVPRVFGVTHPLWIKYKQHLLEAQLDIDSKPFDKLKTDGTLLLLPGSRRFEVSYLLPIFAEAAIELRKRYRLHISIVKASSVKEELFVPYNHLFDSVYSDSQIAEALKRADVALAASGTVTLTTALFQVPTVVCYKLSPLNAFIYRLIVRYYGPVSMANIIFGKYVFPELLQKQATAHGIIKEIVHWFNSEKDYRQAKELLAKTPSMLSKNDSSVAEYMAGVIIS